jgi:hypothetical protein
VGEGGGFDIVVTSPSEPGNGVPQALQKRASARFWAPHESQKNVDDT